VLYRAINTVNAAKGHVHSLAGEARARQLLFTASVIDITQTTNATAATVSPYLFTVCLQSGSDSGSQTLKLPLQ